jgi:hypothetical protein
VIGETPGIGIAATSAAPRAFVTQLMRESRKPEDSLAEGK